MLLFQIRMLVLLNKQVINDKVYGYYGNNVVLHNVVYYFNNRFYFNIHFINSNSIAFKTENHIQKA